MGPTEVEEYLLQDPVPTMRLTLASGDQVIVRDDDKPFLSGLSIVLRGSPVDGRITTGTRLVSIPNIVLLEPIDDRRPEQGRRRR